MNHGENGADPIDWSKILYVRDKLDGSLLKLLKEPDGNDLWTTNDSFDVNVLEDAMTCGKLVQMSAEKFGSANIADLLAVAGMKMSGF